MNAALFDYPAKAAYGRPLPKSKIYEHAHITTHQRQLFVSQVEQIVWHYKLAPETINLPATDSVPEIQIFTLALKTPDLSEDVLRIIDQAVQFPLLYELTHAGRIQTIAAYKAINQGKCAISSYFASPWLPANAPRQTLPLALDMASLYEHLLAPLLPLPPRTGETMAQRVARVEQVQAKQREVDKTAARLARESVYKQRVDINGQLRQLKAEVERLKGD